MHSEKGKGKVEELKSQLLRKIKGLTKMKLLDWAVALRMKGTTRMPLVAELKVDRPGSEETGVHMVWRHKGAAPTKEYFFG